MGFVLALASGIPIAVIALLRAMKIKVLEAPNVYSSVLHRTETSASTAPMMMTSPSTQVRYYILVLICSDGEARIITICRVWLRIMTILVMIT